MRDGGPAFPTNELNADGSVYHQFFGMSLRDHFAGLAIAPVMAALPKDGGVFPAQIAHLAYQLADAMLAEREKP